MKILAAILGLALISPVELQGPEQPDSGLVELVGKVRDAADRRDYDLLHKLMTEDFLFSFGDGRSKDGAIAWFKRQPTLLIKLAEVLSGDCALTEYGAVIHYLCPAEAADLSNPYYEHRAAFRLTNHNNWQFAWFVAGD